MTQKRPRRNNQDQDADQDADEDIDIEPPGFIERWSNYLLSRFDEEDPDRYQEPGAKLRKFHPEDIPESRDTRKKPKRRADGDAPGQGRPKRRRRRVPGALDDGLGDWDDGVVDDDFDGDRIRSALPGGIPPRQPPAQVPPAGVPPAGAPGAGAENAGAAGQGEEAEASWWDYASMAMAI